MLRLVGVFSADSFRSKLSCEPGADELLALAIVAADSGAGVASASGSSSAGLV
jgi:hypothetical protein